MKKLISTFFVLILLLLTLIGCESKREKENYNDSEEPLIQSSQKGFFSVEDYYDFFFTLCEYEDVFGNLQVANCPEGDLAKYNMGEDYYDFIDDIQKGERKIYIPKISDEWEFYDIAVHEKMSPIEMPYVSFCYYQGEECIWVGYSYIPSYYIYDYVTYRDNQLNYSERTDPMQLCREMYKRKSEDYDTIYDKIFSGMYQKQIQLRDRSVTALFNKYKSRDMCRIIFIYDDVCVMFDNLPSKLLTDDFLKDFYLEEYIPPETSTAPAETTQPAA